MFGIILNTNIDVGTKIIIIVAIILSALLAIEFHECAHGYVALWCGDATAKINKRLTLNPVAHFDVAGILMMIFIGFGWAKPVPINPNNFKHYKRDSFFVASAGIVVNVILSAISFGLCCLSAFAFSKVTVVNSFVNGLFTFLIYFFLYGTLLNITLAAFNILPIYPLDGFRMIESFAPRSQFVAFMRKYGRMILFIFLMASFVLGRFWPYFDIIGMYINVIQNSILKLLSTVFGLIF